MHGIICGCYKEHLTRVLLCRLNTLHSKATAREHFEKKNLLTKLQVNCRLMELPEILEYLKNQPDSACDQIVLCRHYLKTNEDEQIGIVVNKQCTNQNFIN